MRVIVVEDQVLLRDGLVLLFNDKGHTVVGSAGDARTVGTLVAETAPDIVVLDVRMPPTFTDEGVTAAKELKAAHPGLGILLLSQHVEQTGVVELVSQAGFGYLLKDRVLEVDDFISSAERVAGGGSALDPTVVAAMVSGQRDGPLSTLSPRELDVLALMAQGLTNNGIGNRLCLSARTIETHVSNVLTKLDVTDSNDTHRRVLAVLSYLRATQ